MNKPCNTNDYGIVAISLSRVFTKGNLGCFAPAGTGKQVIGEALAEMLDEHTHQWGLKRFREMHPRIVAVMFNLAAPWDIGGERLIHLSTSNFVETGNNAAQVGRCYVNMSRVSNGLWRSPITTAES